MTDTRNSGANIRDSKATKADKKAAKKANENR